MDDLVLKNNGAHRLAVTLEPLINARNLCNLSLD